MGQGGLFTISSFFSRGNVVYYEIIGPLHPSHARTACPRGMSTDKKERTQKLWVCFQKYLEPAPSGK